VAIVSKVGGPGNTQTIRGNNNTPQLTSTTQQASDWKAVLAEPAGQVIATALGLALVAGFGFLFYGWRKKKALQNLA
jgi:LPXTG-motif cell wall-anchored protein